MATTATNKQPLLIDRVFHNAIEGNTLSSGSDSALVGHPWYQLILGAG